MHLPISALSTQDLGVWGDTKSIYGLSMYQGAIDYVPDVVYAYGAEAVLGFNKVHVIFLMYRLCTKSCMPIYLPASLSIYCI